MEVVRHPHTASFAAPYAIDLGFFSGPMDLLLHLVHQQEVSIEEVEMSKVAEQFLEIVTQAAMLDLDRATEYLVIAATLMAVKSGSLLPNATGEGIEGFEGEGTEFFEELRERLKLYEITKRRAEELRRRPQLGVDTFCRSVRLPKMEPSDDAPLIAPDASRISMLFASVLKRIGAGANYLRLRLEPISVVAYMVRIVDSLHELVRSTSLIQDQSPGTPFSFMGLLRRFAMQDRFEIRSGSDQEEQAPQGETLGLIRRVPGRARGMIIGSFVGVLELVRRGVLQVGQAEEGNDIVMSFRTGDEVALGVAAVRTQAARRGLDQGRDFVSIADELEADLDAPVVESESIDDRKVVHMSDYQRTDRTVRETETTSSEPSELEQKKQEVGGG